MNNSTKTTLAVLLIGILAASGVTATALANSANRSAAKLFSLKELKTKPK
ncbi:hypothetical protein [Myxosarcina sp. GI1(2024)]